MKTKRKHRLRLAAVIQVVLCLWLWVQIELPLGGRDWLLAIVKYCFWTLINYNVVMKKLRLSANQKRSLATGIRVWSALIRILYRKISRKSRAVRWEKDMEKIIGAVLEKDRTYKNRNGQEYKCLWAGENCAGMLNVSSYWFCIAYGITMHEDGTVEWNYSTGGRYVEF